LSNRSAPIPASSRKSKVPQHPRCFLLHAPSLLRVAVLTKFLSKR
jgi:hypothetical protein